ncbi:MAG: DUF6094 domain-containing protein [Betaproteobacteria bacterium]|nr:DUF6094 domain-containing protein [Betaproteobacteria bacterium]
MALMFPRLARNFAKNGYYPTDEVTLARTLQALQPAPAGNFRIIDPCAGEGVAIAECAWALGRNRTQPCGVEYDYERAEHARTLVDKMLRSDLMDTVITRQAFGLLFLNPPYGDLPSTMDGNSYQGTGRKRLEKLFYQRSSPLLQYGGVMVFIIPHYTLDAELSGWIANHFSDVRVYAAPEKQFKQVVILGVRTKRNDRDSPAAIKAIRNRLIEVGGMAYGEGYVEELPEEWPFEAYTVPAVQRDLEHFYRISLEPEQFSMEIQRLGGLWPEFDLHFKRAGKVSRQPARALSPWHLALSLAAGAISGTVTSQSGKTLIVKGNTHKEKTRKVEYTEDEDGNITEVRTMVDKFVPVIKAWDMTPKSETFGCVLTISSSTSQPEAVAEEPKADETADLLRTPMVMELMPAKFPTGNLVMTAAVSNNVEDGSLNINPFIARHFSGDWGDLSDSDKAQNERALKSGEERIFSSYNLDKKYEGQYGTEDKLWIITEWDRSVTTVLFPTDY